MFPEKIGLNVLMVLGILLVAAVLVFAMQYSPTAGFATSGSISLKKESTREPVLIASDIRTLSNQPMNEENQQLANLLKKTIQEKEKKR